MNNKLSHELDKSMEGFREEGIAEALKKTGLLTPELVGKIFRVPASCFSAMEGTYTQNEARLKEFVEAIIENLKEDNE